MRLGIVTGVVAALLTIIPTQAVGSNPAGSKSALNCRGHSVIDFARPLERMRPIPRVPATGRVSVFPISLRLQRPESVSVGPLKIDFLLVNQGSRNSPGGKGWSASTNLWRVDRTGTPIQSLGSKRQSITGVWRKRSTHMDLGGYRLPKAPRFYRLDVEFVDGSGADTGRFSEYIRVVPRRLDVRLALSDHSLSVDDRLRWRLENFGTLAVSYGLQFGIERYDGASWVDAGLAPKSFPEVGFVTGGGGASQCQAFRVPLNAQPGKYRLIKSAAIGFLAPRDYLAEFEVTE